MLMLASKIFNKRQCADHVVAEKEKTTVSADVEQIICLWTGILLCNITDTNSKNAFV